MGATSLQFHLAVQSRSKPQRLPLHAYVNLPAGLEIILALVIDSAFQVMGHAGFEVDKPLLVAPFESPESVKRQPLLLILVAHTPKEHAVLSRISYNFQSFKSFGKLLPGVSHVYFDMRNPGKRGCPIGC
jgi:hypothetical protein